MDLSGMVINEKLYRILQIFLSNKCQASIELVNLISAENLSLNYLQALSLKIAIDSSARLVHRSDGKIILPYEHWTNAIFLKHCSGPGGIHLNLESTIKAIVESYSCGKENFGFDRDFIVEVLSTCPSSTCRFSSSFKSGQQQPPPPPPFDQQPIPSHHQNFAQPMEYGTPNRSPLMTPIDTSKINMNRSVMTSQHITQQIMQQQQQQHNRMNQTMDLEKQRVMQQLDKKHFETVAAIVQANQMNPGNMHNHTKSIDYSRRPSYDGIETYSAGSYSTSNRELLHNNWITQSPNNIQQLSFDQRDSGMIAGQEKIVRAFAELMKNMARMKAFIRPSMVKPYGKQSENLQKTLIDSINLVQTLRNFLPKPHISVTNWKNIENIQTTGGESQTIQ
ncbi:hypothetical protein PVAND_010669 [Polypedilum vanderplanki]|uniref:Genetic suppressor element-like domain-containing protein n=1 Tax=Polypedilum vanderplanki TaxID=319348 RepID=A0A9J6CH72_POLVA|nr:hypothetical protein PVAND_010669 [Polypedilum vanderplanki]